MQVSKWYISGSFLYKYIWLTRLRLPSSPAARKHISTSVRITSSYIHIKAHTSNRFTAAGVSLSEYRLSDYGTTTPGAAVGVLKYHFGDRLVVYIRCESSIAKCAYIYYINIYKYHIWINDLFTYTNGLALKYTSIEVVYK